MKKELELLCDYLKKNGYEDDSKKSRRDYA